MVSITMYIVPVLVAVLCVGTDASIGSIMALRRSSLTRYFNPYRTTTSTTRRYFIRTTTPSDVYTRRTTTRNPYLRTTTPRDVYTRTTTRTPYTRAPTTRLTRTFSMRRSGSSRYHLWDSWFDKYKSSTSTTTQRPTTALYTQSTEGTGGSTGEYSRFQNFHAAWWQKYGFFQRKPTIVQPTKTVYLADESLGTGLRISVYLPKDEYENCLAKTSAKVTTTVHDNAVHIWCLRKMLWKLGIQNPAKGGLADSGINDRGEKVYRPTRRPPYTSRPTRTTSTTSTTTSTTTPETPTSPWNGTCDISQFIPRRRNTPLIRKEYRALTAMEKQKFHTALNRLYAKGIMDCFSMVHADTFKTGGAHGGPAFLPWHRVFLALFEEALQREDPSVALPYWDSSKDYKLQSPLLSVMWDNEHMGPGKGEMDGGPCEDWWAINSPLTRDIATGGGSLVTEERILEVMDNCFLKDFFDPWEEAHNGVHRWVGGALARVYTASDPVFYLHHTFVDYQWEKFRERQNSSVCYRVDPTKDYPDTNTHSHKPDTPMDQMEWYQNKDGIDETWTKYYFQYEDSPTCENGGCYGESLVCRSRGGCVPRERMIIDQTPYRRRKRSTGGPYDSPECRSNAQSMACQKRVVETLKKLARSKDDLPGDLRHVKESLDNENLRGEQIPKPAGRPVFKDCQDEYSDPRTYQTAVLGILAEATEAEMEQEEQQYVP